nr:sensor domain-containing protein [Mycolicibacter engbaekii]
MRATRARPVSTARRTPPNTPAPVIAHPDKSNAPGARSRRGLLVAAGTATALSSAVGAALAWHPWTRHDSSAPSSRSIASATTTIAPVITAPTPPPPPPVFAASDIDTVLLKPSEIANMTSDHFRGYSPDGHLEVLASSLGMSDNAFAIDPPDCAGVIFGAERQVYADTGYQAIRDQTLGKDGTTIDGLIEQTVVVFPTIAEAQASLSASTFQWRKCASGHPDPDPRFPAATQVEFSIG